MSGETIDSAVPRSGFVPSATVSVRIPRLAGPRYLLITCPGGAADRCVPLAEGVIRVGGRRGVDLLVADPTVSGLHCEIRNRGGRVTVRDHGSKNGVRIQGVRVPEGEVAVGQSIELGHATLTLLDREPRQAHSAELLPGVVGESLAMQQLARRVRRLAGSELSVIIRGETGTGKELIARALHELGRRRHGPFVALNCGALPENLVESELFGHERGAFTGAERARPGLIEAADGGTLFLDEIAELPAAQQPKLLRVLERRRVRRLGSQRTRPVDIRLVAATHANLVERIATGRFRQDLYYRLGEASLRIPSLAQRRADIPLLTRHFLREACQELKTTSPDGVPPVLMGRLQQAPFRGNVRELRSLVRRAVVLGWQEALEALPAAVEPGDGAEGGVESGRMAAEAPSAYPLHLPELQRHLIIEAYERAGGNQSEAARLLGMPKSTYSDRLRRIRCASGRRG